MGILHYCLLFFIFFIHSFPPYVASQHLLDVLLSHGVRSDRLSPAVYLFTLDLYKKNIESDKDGNIFFSPISIYIALAMLYAGSEGETKKQLASTLHLDTFTSETEFYETIVNLHEAMNSLRRNYILQMGNLLYSAREIPIKLAFILKPMDYFRARLVTSTFRNYSDILRLDSNDVNAWVEGMTSGRIRDLLPRSAITNDTAIVLDNGVYFKSAWLNAFDEKETSSETFRDPTNQKIKVPMMHRIFPEGVILFAESKDKAFSLFELPFKDNRVSMIFTLDQRHKFGSYLNSTVFDTPWDQDFDVFTNVSLHLVLPKFNLQQTVNLKKVLQAYGVKDVFDNAQLTGIAESGPLRLSDAYHKASFVVDEYGAEAAGATGLGIITKSAERSLKLTYTITVDRPFLFLVIDKMTGCVLFFAHVKNPLNSS